MTREEKLLLVQKTDVSAQNVQANQETYDTKIATIDNDQVNKILIEKHGDNMKVSVGVNMQDDTVVEFLGSSVYMPEIMQVLKDTVLNLMALKNAEIDNDLTQLEQPTNPTE